MEGEGEGFENKDIKSLVEILEGLTSVEFEAIQAEIYKIRVHQC